MDFNAKIVRTPDELAIMLGALRAAGVDIFHASTRWFDRPEWPDSDLGLAGWTKSLTGAPVIAVGSIGLDEDLMDNLFGKEAHPARLDDLVRRFNNREFDPGVGRPREYRGCRLGQ